MAHEMSEQTMRGGGEDGVSIDLTDLPDAEFEGTVDVDDLYVDGDNPNEMTDETFGLLKDRLRENGWLGGPIITDTTGCIADGEHRWRAAKQIGLAEVPVRQYELADETRRLWRLELNKIRGEHDPKRDALEIDALINSQKGDAVEELVNATGGNLDEILDRVRQRPSASPGYEYQAAHEVHYEDCVEGMKQRLDDDSVDMVFTSPPYNIGKGATGGRSSETVDYEDDRSDEEFRTFLQNVATELVRVTKPSGHIFINLGHDYGESEINPSYWIQDLVPAPLRSIIVWDKHTFYHAHLPERGQFHDSYEPIYHFSHEPIYHFSPEESALFGKKQSGVWTIPPANVEGEDYGDHPAPFPVALVEKAMQYTTEEGDLVLDPFLGSGTTAVAAIRNNRDAIGFELDEEGAYKPIIERRIREAKRSVGSLVDDEEAPQAGENGEDDEEEGEAP